MKKIVISFFTINVCLLSTLLTLAQDIHWNNAPQKGFVFEISNKEAQKLLTSSVSDTIFKGLLHTQIDTFDVRKGWLNRPSKGHFILSKIIANKLYCEYTCVFPYQVFLLKEYDAMAIQVLDLNGHLREDAIVKLRHRRLRIDPQSKTYRIENEWFRGDHRMVTVELDGFQSIFDIHKHEVPTRYNNYNNDDGPSFYSYMITDKNMYKPNEKVRFKSYALSQFKSPLQKELEVYLTDYRKTIKIGHVNPHRPGSYADEFQLHDSLKLTLDKSYYLQLREKTGRIVASCSFRYEDYELFGNKLDVQLAKDKQFYPEKNEINITATDVNGLILKDAKASILVKVQSIQETFQPLVILPDTLFFTTIELDPDKPTKLEIPAGLFQKTNIVYQVIVSVLNSQNQRMERTETATYVYSQYELVNRFSHDSICFDILNNGVPMKNVPIKLRHNGEPEGKEVHLPYKEKLNPAITMIKLENELVFRQISMANLNPALNLIGGIQKDSFNIQLQNPQKIDISWYIYQGSNLLKKGSGKELEYKSIIEDRSLTYYVELLYSFGGEEHLVRRQYEFKEEFLDVSLNIPERVYPGQTVDASILVRNQAGEPIHGVDLTAFAVTGKLNYFPPDLPYYGETSSPRDKKDTYSKRDINMRSAVLDLDYEKWEKPARLDTMKYFQFTYPRSKPFNFTVDISDSTQFAPYVMQNGLSKQVFVIEVNCRPVYYSWVDQPKEYSFYVSPVGKKEISLRLYDRVLVLDSMSFEAGKKTILSFDLEHLPIGIKEHKLEQRLTPIEISRHTAYISAFRNTFSYVYLESGTEFTPLFSYHGNTYMTAGPIIPGKKTYRDKFGVLETTYNHTGGYSYAFEDNIVYKLNASNLLPGYLTNIIYNPMNNINDRVMTKKHFLESRPQYDTYKWHARVIDVIDPDSRIKILLPYEKEESGINAIQFENCITKSTVTSYKDNYNSYCKFYSIPEGFNNLMVLYNNGYYLKMDSILLRPHVSVVVDLNHSGLHLPDSLSKEMLYNHPWMKDDFNYSRVEINSSKNTLFYNAQVSDGNVNGTITDETNTPMPGVSILIKGTSRGVISDINGHFSIWIDDSKTTLSVSFIGYIAEDIEVMQGSNVSITMTPDIQELSEVVVVGYGVQKKCDLTGAISSVSEREIMSVPEDKALESKQEDNIIRDVGQRLYEELLTLKSIRSNFSDVGFWEPRLYTDGKGVSKFKITFPDDITRWDAVVYAMNRYLQTGTARKSIKSYKPLMAELNVPQFLTQGDSAFFLGKVLNYTTDSSILGKVKWSGAQTDFERDIQFTNYHTDKLPVNANSIDSVRTRYVFTRIDGYLDGEERTVPVVEQGIIRAEGELSFLKNGDDKYVKAPENGTLKVEIMDNQIGVYEQEVNSLLNYKYACNEQLASKLSGLINHKMLMRYEGKPFKYDKDVNKIIDRLLKNQNQEFLWSWWDVSSNTSYWMSAHILRALKYAKDAGYKIDLDIENIARKAEYKFRLLQNYSLYDIDLLNAIAGWGVKLNYAKHIHILNSLVRIEENWEKVRYLNYHYCYSHLNEKLLLQEIRQMTGLPYQRDSLLRYKKEGIMGEVYFSDNKPSYYWYNDKMTTNLIAYRLVKKDSLLKDLRVPMQMYFLSLRKEGGWNTYQSSNVLMSILPDLMAEGVSKEHAATTTLSGKEHGTVTQFPYRLELQPKEELHIHKESGMPLYYMQYVKERVTKAKTGVEGFEIKTSFSKDSVKLEAGKPVALRVEINVKKDASFENVMVEVPIPGACSYADKRQLYNGVEVHREYFKDRTVIFCETMNAGKYIFLVYLLPRFTGKYLMNPAQVSLMYVPVVNANTDIKLVEVNQKE